MFLYSKPVKKMCPYCQKEFETEYVTKIYCSKKHQKYAKQSRRTGKGIKGIKANYPEKCKKCEVCGLDEWEILVLHHRDRNPKNKNINNLQVLCPNCHTRIHKYGYKKELFDLI
jgi:5-methylcytosine-specific restriction endonuclease McrA